MDKPVERLVVAIGYQVDRASEALALRSYAQIAAGIAAAGVAVAGFTISQAAADDEITKTAHALGMQTEAYTALTYAMGREGVKQEQVNQGLKAFQMQLEGAARGSGEALPWLRDMGIATEDMAGGVRLAGDVLPELARGLQGLSEGDLRGASLKLFGENGLFMGKALAKGTDNLDDLIARAHELGVVLSEEDAAAAEHLTDAMTDLRGSVSGLTAGVARELTPALIPLVEGLTDWMVESELLGTTVDRVTSGLVWSFEQLQTPAGQAAAAIGGVVAAIGTASMAGSLYGAATAAVPALGMLGTAATGAAAPFLVAAAAVGVGVLVIDDLIVAANGGDSAIMHLAESLGYADEAQALLTGSIEKTSELQEMLNAATETGGTLWTLFAHGTQHAAISLHGARMAMTPMQDAFNKVNPVVWANNAAWRALGATLEWWSGIAVEAWGSLLDFKGAAQGFENFAGWLEGDPNIQYTPLIANSDQTQGAGQAPADAYGLSYDAFDTPIRSASATGESAAAVNQTIAPIVNISMLDTTETGIQDAVRAFESELRQASSAVGAY